MDGSKIQHDEDERDDLEQELNQQTENSQQPDLVDTNELEMFRKQWKKELSLRHNQTPDKQSDQLRGELEAASLYWTGAAAERSGDMRAAVNYYRHAIQLVPDIEFRVTEDQLVLDNDASSEGHEGDDANEDDNVLTKLLDDFQTLSIGPFCQPERPATTTHISSLPTEIFRYILRWTVSSQLDMRTLELVSCVCKGFYCLAREPLLWSMVCKKLWNPCESPAAYGGSWRRMFILKPHLYFNGVYISRVSYDRSGEKSLDGLYKPFHIVTYYRYLRFFPDGSVMYQTSPEEPAQTVSRLFPKHSSDSVLLGNYSLQDNTVVVDVLSNQGHTPLVHHRARGGRGKQLENTQERSFHMEFILSSSDRRRSNHLTWDEFYCCTLHKPTGLVQTSHFSLREHSNMYTPFYFSRVRSFTTNSTGLLN